MARQDHRKKRPMVVGRQGRYRFQTGMVTAHLLKRGLPAAVAFSLSRQLREAVTGRGEVTTDELRAEIDRLLVEVGYDSLEIGRAHV